MTLLSHALAFHMALKDRLYRNTHQGTLGVCEGSGSQEGLPGLHPLLRSFAQPQEIYHGFLTVDSARKWPQSNHRPTAALYIHGEISMYMLQFRFDVSVCKQISVSTSCPLSAPYCPSIDS